MPKKKARAVDARDNIKLVTSNRFITAYGTEELTLKARKLLFLAIAQCRQNDKKFYEYAITPIEFSTIMGIDVSNLYQEVESITQELMSLSIRITEADGGFTKFHVFNKCTYSPENDIVFRLNDEMAVLLLNLTSNFSKPLLSDFTKMKSNYAMQTWHVMQSKMNIRKPTSTETITIYIRLDELRQATGTQDKLPQLVHFKERVLDRTIKEVRTNAGVDISYTNVKKGRTVVGFDFTARSTFYFDVSKLDPDFIQAVEERAEAARKKGGII